MSITIVDSGVIPAHRLALADKPPVAPGADTIRPLPDGRGSDTRCLPSDGRGTHEQHPLSDPIRCQDHDVEVVDRLRKRLEDYRRRRARQAGWTRRFVPTGLAAIDAALPHGGLPGGAVTEILADDAGVGAITLALRIAKQCTGMVNDHTNHDRFELRARDENALADKPPVAPGADTIRPLPDGRGSDTRCLPSDGRGSDMRYPLSDPDRHRDGSEGRRFVVVVDTAGDFYPPAAGQHGIDLRRLIVVRVRRRKEAFWAVEQALRCRTVGAVIAPLTHLDEGQSRRLQLAAESTGCVGLILRPARQRSKSFAAVRMHVTGVSPKGTHLSSHADTAATGGGRYTWQSMFRTTGATAGLPASACLDESRPLIRAPSLVARIGRGTDASGDPPVSSLGKGGHIECHNRDAYWCRIELLTVREGMPVEPILVDLHHETGDVPVHPVPVDRPAARTG